MPTKSKSQTSRPTRSGDSQHSPDADPSIDPSRIANYPVFNPYAFFNAEPSSSILPGPLPATHPDVTPFTNHIHGDSSPAGFLAIPAHPSYQSHVAPWPLIPQPFNPIVPSSAPPRFADSQRQGQMLSPAIDRGPSRLGQPSVSVPSTSQITSPTASSQRSASIDPEEAVILDDKRRRNTIASARFRVKKKQKNLNLERAVSDLTSRAEELEREASNLRRENGWLKEMVMMRGQQNLIKSLGYLDEGALSDGGESSEGRDEGTPQGLDTKQISEGEMGRWKGAKTAEKKRRK